MAPVRITAIVERSSDGLYSVYSEDHFGNSYLGGYGDSVEQAKADFLESIKEAIAEQRKENHNAPEMKDINVEYRFDLPSFFNYFDFINVTKFAEYVGINESKMRAYKSGVSYPGEKTTNKIFKAVKEIGQELCIASFL
jgi:hypothetical protein